MPGHGRGVKVNITPDYLTKVSIELLQTAGVGLKEAGLVAETLVTAELRGVPTHGINLLPAVFDRIAAGQMEVPTKLKVISDEQAATHIDGGNGFGQTAAAEGMQRSIEKARSFGIGFSLIRNTNNVGLLAYYSMMAAKAGTIGICACNGAASMAPWGGAEPFFGTNPFSLAAPAGSGNPVVLDMSTTVVARGKIRRAERLKEQIPLGWALDAGGAPTKDPIAAMQGTLMPLGEYKGYGMAFFIDLICGLLSGSSYSRAVRTFHQPEGPTGVGVMTIAIDISRFMPLGNFSKLIDEHIRTIRGSVKAKGQNRIYLPGEIEAELESLNITRGVAVDAPVVKAIDDLLEKRGLSMRLKDGEVRV
ncbi:MAG: Ldh family oxidoreductase [Spirochaetales bacterium]|nr:MAG: Ldh family oxidoreductase [Spirochaetales bacterium]